MHDTYSLDEASTRFADIIARVRGGETVTISDHGTAVAEVRPAPARRQTIEERLDELEARGELIRPPKGARSDFTPGEPRPGALARFLAERE